MEREFAGDQTGVGVQEGHEKEGAGRHEERTSFNRSAPSRMQMSTGSCGLLLLSCERTLADRGP
jgi:hypothetical protein